MSGHLRTLELIIPSKTGEAQDEHLGRALSVVLDHAKREGCYVSTRVGGFSMSVSPYPMPGVLTVRPGIAG